MVAENITFYTKDATVLFGAVVDVSGRILISNYFHVGEQTIVEQSNSTVTLKSR
jgi:hypothetical protein